MSNVRHLNESKSALSLSVSSTKTYSRLDPHIQRKLGYEWKNIFRKLQAQQMGTDSVVSTQAFNQACVFFGVILTNEEVQRLQ